ncbi:MAG: hypothetical protein HYZ49_13070 [Chloroflexi bacterium]|nr:hypothetical protein [Chloroflexota bacterium]
MSRSKRFWSLILLLVLARVMSVWLLKPDPAYVLIPRGLNGRGLLTQPSWFDLAIPLATIVMLQRGRFRERITVRSAMLAVGDASGLLLFPLLTGLGLFVYIYKWYVSPQVVVMNLLRWGQFVLAFLALNLMLDTLTVRNRYGRLAVGLLVTLMLGPTQEMYATIDGEWLFLVVLNSVGTTLALTALAFRPLYHQSPWRATLAAVIVGGLSCLFIVTGGSDSVLTLALPSFSFLIGALAIRSAKWWPRWAALAGTVTVALLFSLGLPRLVPPEQRTLLIESIPEPSHTEQVEGITVRYEDSRVREVTVRLARVLAAANQVSQESFGVSPQANELVIGGIEPGGFYAEFPHSIRGNLASERYIELSLDNTYLNSPDASIHFADPINAILHEYSHLYGIVPYWPWVMGSEEEGWATYGATRLARRLYERFGPGLWDPPYDYAARAEAITQSNLNGHPVAWSHPDEFGGFRLWYELGQRDGEGALFRRRWELTRRDSLRFLMIVNDPDMAQKMADELGRADFVSFGSGRPVRYAQLYDLQDLQPLGDVMGMSRAQVTTLYDRRADEIVDPTIKVPAPTPVELDLGATTAVLLLTVWLAMRVFSRRDKLTSM